MLLVINRTADHAIGHEMTDFLIYTDNGLKIKDAGFWFDSFHEDQKTFVSSAFQQKKALRSTVFASDDTISLLSLFHKKMKALSCPFQHSFAIGPFFLELLPNGSSLGGASLYLSRKKETIFYVSARDLKLPHLFGSAIYKKTDILIVRADRPLVTDKPRDVLLKPGLLLENAIANAHNSPVTIYCEPTTCAFYLYDEFFKLGLVPDLHRQIKQGLQIYKRKNPQLWADKHPPCPITLKPYKPLDNLTKNSFLVLTSPDVKGSSYFFSPGFTSQALLELSEKTDPKKIYFVGPYAKEYFDVKLSVAAEKIIAPYNNQAPLF